MTGNDIAEMRALLAKAEQRRLDAPKPTIIDANAWAKLHCDEPMQFVTVGWDGFAGETVAIVYGDDDEQEQANAALIVAAVNALPALLDEIEHLRTIQQGGRDD